MIFMSGHDKVCIIAFMLFAFLLSPGAYNDQKCLNNQTNDVNYIYREGNRQSANIPLECNNEGNII